MGIMDFAKPQTTAAARGLFGANGQQDRPKAQTWINIGLEVNGKFVNLPMGMALDTMAPVEVKGQNEDWIKLQTARNAFLKELQAYADQLQPGQEATVFNVEVRVRRVNESTEVDPTTNEYHTSGLLDLLAGKKPE